MRKTNNVFKKVHNCTNFKWWFTQFERKCNILEIFEYHQYFKRFRSMKKWQISKPKIVDWYLDFSKESYITLKSIISSFKICFQNYGQLKRKFLRSKITSSTFLKFELSRLSGPIRKTRKNTIRNQFEQQWFNVISFQKPRRIYKAIWCKCNPFAIKKGRFKLSTPAKGETSDDHTSHVKLSKGGQSINITKKSLNSKRFTSMKSDFSVQNNIVSVCCSYLSMHGVSIYWKCQVSTRENISTTTFQIQARKNLKRQRLRYISQNDRLPLLSLLDRASLKVRPRTDGKDVSQDSCCFFGL